MKAKKGIISLVLVVLIFSLMKGQSTYALDLPLDIVNELHTKKSVAMLSDSKAYWTTTLNEFSGAKYYKSTIIDTNGLYSLSAYNTLIMWGQFKNLNFCSSLTSEQMNTIIEYVRGGGGLIIGYSSGYYTGTHTVIQDLLSKFGIDVIIGTTYSQVELIKDNQNVLTHPVTTGFDKLKLYINYPIVKIEGATPFIKSPFVAVYKDFGSGRIIIFGNGQNVPEESSGLRLMVNCIEYVMGNTPQGWSPSVDTIVAQQDKTIEQLQLQIKDMQNNVSQITDLKNQINTLNGQMSSLNSQITQLQTDKNSLNLQVNQLQSEKTSLQIQHTKLQQDYDSLKKSTSNGIPGYPIESIIVASILLTVFYLYKSRKTRESSSNYENSHL